MFDGRGFERFALRRVGDLDEEPVMRPTQFGAVAPNRKAAVELKAFLERAPVDGRVRGEFLQGPGAVVGAVAEEQDVFVDETAGLVVGLELGAVDGLASRDDNGGDGVTQLGVGLRRWGQGMRRHELARAELNG